MTESTKTVFEKYEIRKTKKQKSAFIDFVKSEAEKSGYEFKTEKGFFGAKNIIVGNPTEAKVVFTAHYDTCPVLPFPNFITPKSILIYILYQLLLTVVIFFAAAVASFVIGCAVSVVCGIISSALISAEYYGAAEALREAMPDIISLATAFGALGLFSLMLFGPANKHTANDNTSGVTTLLDMMSDMPEEQKKNAAFIFFDLEEMGLFGSAGYASKHGKEMKKKPVINFDCVSDGKHILFVLRKKSKKYKAVLEKVFTPEGDFVPEVLTGGYVYPSDQASFPVGIGVAACKAHRTGILYMDRIHTKKDTVYMEENIEYLKRKSIELTEVLEHTSFPNTENQK